jgi:HEAT repeat protein
VTRPDLGDDAETLQRLSNGLGDASSVVRYYCADALGKRRAKSAVRRLTLCLTDDDEDVRAASAEALGLIGDVEACATAAAAADREFRVDARWLRAMALSGTDAALKTVMDLANSNLLANQRAGLEALGASPLPAAQARVLQTFRNDEAALQSVAADALLQRGNAVVPVLKQEAAAPEYESRARAVFLLGRLGTREARGALQALQNDADARIKALVQHALSRPALLDNLNPR